MENLGTIQSPADITTGFIPFEGKKALVVDDNEMNREIATEILEDYGVIVEQAEDGDIAVEMVKNSEDNRYDLVLMDVQMPRMNGYEATKKIRKLENRSVAMVPIIAMTANAFEEDRKNAIKACMDGHLSKPISIPKLVETLSRFYSLRNHHSDSGT